MKKNIAKLFFMSLLKSLLCIVIVLGVGVISYNISYKILSNGGGLGSSDDEIDDIIKEASIDEVSKNLIYVSNEKNRITHLMLEICNTKTNNMDYITIPVKADYTIPSVMYRKLCTVNPEIPQVIRLAKLKQYFDADDKAYGYGVLIFEKMLGIDISYYTAISEEIYENHYEEKKVKIAYKTKSAINNTPAPDGTTPVSDTTITTKMKISILSESYINQIKDLGDDKDKIGDYIKEQYDRVASNLTMYNKIGYITAYQKINVDHYHFWGVPGVYNDGVFEVDTKATKKALKQLEENETSYTEPHDLSQKNMITIKKSSKKDSDKANKEVESSKGLDIYVLNGSQIAGLASRTKEKLEGEGYTVPKIGNYTKETLTTTKIIVSKEGQGEDLAEYFSDPEITVGDVTSGYDIEIILGTADAN